MNQRNDHNSTMSFEDYKADRVEELHREVMTHHDIGDALAELGGGWAERISAEIVDADCFNSVQRNIRMARLGSLVHECMSTYAKGEAEKMFNAEVKKQTEQMPE
jgi:hypothetical protein